ncbi:hypothetical protein XAP6164_2100011 [Xanthomonas phaseoli pv. phaseoli]|nr:hypothetical protein XAP6164_2100011 [Xanthomonas phaseoli pv. phaseoli]
MFFILGEGRKSIFCCILLNVSPGWRRGSRALRHSSRWPVPGGEREPARLTRMPVSEELGTVRCEVATVEMAGVSRYRQTELHAVRIAAAGSAVRPGRWLRSWAVQVCDAGLAQVVAEDVPTAASHQAPTGTHGRDLVC